MSHMVKSMAPTDNIPWHGLGCKVSNNLTPVQMMQAARADWKVREAESYVTFDGKQILTGKKCLIREDTGKILTHVGRDWHSFQNIKAFEFFNEYIQTNVMDMDTAGSLKDGKIVWALAKVKDTSFDLFGGDRVDSYLLFSNPHQYGKSINIRFTPIRVVCYNTLTWALGVEAKRGVRMSHAIAFDEEGVKKTLGIAREEFASCKEMAEFLGKKQYSKDSLYEYYSEIFLKDSSNLDKKISEIVGNAKRCLELVETQPGAEYAKGSWWQAFNSVTYLTDHIQGKTREGRLYNQWYGKNQLRKIKAAEKAVEYARAA